MPAQHIASGHLMVRVVKPRLIIHRNENNANLTESNQVHDVERAADRSGRASRNIKACLPT
jgi:hypothetical protein